MNKRIKELYKEAYGVRLSTDDFVLDSKEKKFAELIMLECISRVTEIAEEQDKSDLSVKMALAEVVLSIEDHFGIN